ncbi:MAG TPA: amidase [Solirubrobacteraceae bacterium]|nr:amidase [Solirubrobacteraceae bacterium]
MDASDVAFAGAAAQARMVAAGEISARELTELCLARIERLNPQLNAFRLVLAEEALAQATRADEMRAAGEPLPLLGVPVAVKDDTDVAGTLTAYGSNAQESPATVDSEAVRRLRAAGAVIIGKTNVPELTQWPFTETATFGATRNPWDLQRTPGGSSGGSGAAVAAGLVGAATATDGAGSIRIPAAWCGLFGLKPQRDRVSMSPRKNPWFGMAVMGSLTRTVGDSALMLDVMAGPASGEADAVPPPERPFGASVHDAPRGLRIAYSTALPPGTIATLAPAGQQAVDETVQLLRDLGHEVFERDIDYGPLAIATVVARYLRGIKVEAGNVAHPERLERRTRGMALLGSLVPQKYVDSTIAGEAQFAERVGALFTEFDVILTPATAVGAPAIGALEGRGALWTLNTVAGWVPYYGVWNVTGQPAASVPAGRSADGMPRSVQLVGRFADEATLLALAAQLEAARPWAHERPPLFA